MLSALEADAVVAEARAHADRSGWSTQRHRRFPTTDVPASELLAVEPLIAKARATLELALREHCGLDDDADELTANDKLVVYYAPEQQAGLATHQDGSFLAFNLALSDEYEGGGTTFPQLNRTARLRKGDALIPPASNRPVRSQSPTPRAVLPDSAHSAACTPAATKPPPARSQLASRSSALSSSIGLPVVSTMSRVVGERHLTTLLCC